jgi:hypothetical protein
MNSSIVSINLPERHQKMLAKILKARGFPERGRSAYVRACIEADYLDLQTEAHVARHNAKVRKQRDAIARLQAAGINLTTLKGKTK